MKILRVALLVLVIVAALAGFFWLGYSLYNRYSHNSVSPFQAIPGNTALVIKLNKAGNLLSELNRSNLLWHTLTRFPGIGSIREELNYLDSASRKNEKINALFRQSNVLVSITLIGRSDFGALYLTPVSGVDPAVYIKDFIADISHEKPLVTESPYAAAKIYRISMKDQRNAFYYAVMKGLFIGSFHSDLVKRSIDRLSLNTPMAYSAGFQRVESASGKNADANVFINYRFFSLVLSRVTSYRTLPDLVQLSDFADWSGLDLIIKKDELLMNGITVASDTGQQFLALFHEQKPQIKKIMSVIPEESISLISYGWSDPLKFTMKLQNRSVRDEFYTDDRNEALAIIERNQLNVKEYFLPWIGSEAGVFQYEDPVTMTGTKYLVFEIRDSVLMRNALFSLADSLGLPHDSLRYQGHRIYRVPLPAFFPILFGELFSKVNPAAFTCLGNYAVFAATSNELEPIIAHYVEGRTLEKNQTFRDFIANLSDRSNVFCYMNTSKSARAIRELIDPELAARIIPVMDSLKKFESVAFQYGSSGDLFYSGIFLRYNPHLGSDGPVEWRASLDTTISGYPAILPITRDNKKCIAVTDSLSNLYLIAPSGQILWKLHIMGKRLSEIHPLTIPGSDSNFLLFNTDTHLYLLHADGRFADKFPMRFPLNAVNGLATVSDHPGEKPEILIAFQDNRIYRFNLKGESVREWKRPGLKDDIHEPVKVIRSGERTFIAISGSTGTTRIVDNDGNDGIILRPTFNRSPNADLYINRTNKKGALITTTIGGKVVFLSVNGAFSEVTLNMFSDQHRFFYEDITGSGQPEFIYSDRNAISYYDRRYKLVYHYAFRRDINAPPFVVHGEGGKIMIGYVVPETHELFLFDRNGYRELASGIRGTTRFDIGQFEPANPMKLVVGDGKFLKCYRLTQE